MGDAVTEPLIARTPNWTPEAKADPALGYGPLFDGCPVARVEDQEIPYYLVSRYGDVMDLLRRVEVWSSAQGAGIDYQAIGVLGSADRPVHTTHRRAVGPAFTPPLMAAMEPQVAALARGLFDEFVERGNGDFVEDFAHPFPALVIAELLGVPADDRERFRAWSEAIVTGLGGEAIADRKQAIAELDVYVRHLIAGHTERQDGGEAPDAGLLAHLVSLHRLTGEVSHDEIVGLAIQLLVAGHETTTSLIGLMVYRLANDRALFERLRGDRSLLDAMVEESLRIESPVQTLFRTPTEAVELHGCPIDANTKTGLSFAAANRDPEVWERPDEFDLDRFTGEHPRHLAFGHGIHHCVGAPLARREGRVALELVLDHMDDPEVTGEVTFVRPSVLRGLRTLPLRWTPRTT
ncbi:MAG: cytochrome P450 [Ilumatobacteraceae bacterium]